MLCFVACYGYSGSCRIVDEVFDFLKDQNSEYCFERIPESFYKAYFKGNTGIVAEEDRDNFDYVYNVKELIELKGRKFHDKKNRVNKFRNRYTYEYMPLTDGLIAECLEYEDYWCDTRDCEKNPLLVKEFR